MTPDFWRVGQWGIAFAVAGSFVWTVPPIVRHGFGIVVSEKTDAPSSRRAQDKEPTLDLSAVLALAPFGRAAAPALPNQADTSTTWPELSLKGIVAASESRSSVALISVSQVQDLFRAGDPIADAFVVDTVERDFVVLRSDSERITLRFDDESVRSEDAPVASENADSINDRLRDAAIVANQIATPGPPETMPEYIAYWRRKIRKNPQQVLDTIGLKPTDGGYRIAQEHNRGVRLAGLLAGDLVRSINGRALGDPDQDRLAYDEIAASGQARLEVQRGDKTLTFSFPLR